MVVQFDRIEPLRSENSNRSHAATYAYDSQTSPLDLSRTSTRFPFVHRSTSTDYSPSSPIDLSIKSSGIDTRQTSIGYLYEQPMIMTQPKRKWHYRSIKDLAKKHIPFLSGVGSQRTPIRLKIPKKSDRQMYLGISVVTHDGQPHDSKVIVPAKTKVNTEHLSHDNNLNRLQFDECNSTDYFHPTTRHVYLQINDEEHMAQLKEVRIYMFNLYQNQTITKDIIEAKQLHLCRLAFWLCFFDNNQYIPISEPSFSCIIQEKKTSTRSCVSQQVTTPMNLLDPYTMPYIQYCNQNDMNNGDDNFFGFFTIKPS